MSQNIPQGMGLLDSELEAARCDSALILRVASRPGPDIDPYCAGGGDSAGLGGEPRPA